MRLRREPEGAVLAIAGATLPDGLADDIRAQSSCWPEACAVFPANLDGDPASEYLVVQSGNTWALHLYDGGPTGWRDLLVGEFRYHFDL